MRVRVLRDGAPRDELSIVRAEVHAPTVYQKLLPNGIGYIAVGVFGEPTAEEFGAALRHLQRANARAFVIDLRNNGGGYVNAAVGDRRPLHPLRPDRLDRRAIRDHRVRRRRERRRDAPGRGAGQPLLGLGLGDPAAALQD